MRSSGKRAKRPTKTRKLLEQALETKTIDMSAAVVDAPPVVGLPAPSSSTATSGGVGTVLPTVVQPRPTSFKGWDAAREGLRAGDHVWVSCGVYGHHGIYVGDGRFIHKVSGSGSLATAAFSCNASVVSVGGGLIFTGFKEFSPNSEATLHVVQYRESFHPKDTVDLAFTALRAKDLYRLMDANCEHFACWAKTGLKQSGQVVAVKNALLQNFAAASSFVSCTAVFSRFSSLHDTSTETRTTHGRGLRRLLGLGRRTETTTITTVNTRRVLAAAGAGAIVGVLVYSLARRLKKWLLRQQHRQLSFRLLPPVERNLAAPDVATPGGLVGTAEEDKAVQVHRWRIRTAEELLDNIRRALPDPLAAPSSLKDVLFFSPKDLCFLPLQEADMKRLPRVTSLMLAAQQH